MQLSDGILVQFKDSSSHPLVFGNGISQKFEASLLSQFQGPSRNLEGFLDNLLFGKSLAAIGPFSPLELFASVAVLGGSTVASLTVGASEAILSPSLATGVIAAAIHLFLLVPLDPGSSASIL